MIWVFQAGSKVTGLVGGRTKIQTQVCFPSDLDHSTRLRKLQKHDNLRRWAAVALSTKREMTGDKAEISRASTKGFVS